MRCLKNSVSLLVMSRSFITKLHSALQIWYCIAKHLTTSKGLVHLLEMRIITVWFVLMLFISEVIRDLLSHNNRPTCKDIITQYQKIKSNFKFYIRSSVTTPSWVKTCLMSFQVLSVICIIWLADRLWVGRGMRLLSDWVWDHHKQGLQLYSGSVWT